MKFKNGNKSMLLSDHFKREREGVAKLYETLRWCMGPYDKDPDNNPFAWYDFPLPLSAPSLPPDKAAKLCEWYEKGGF